MRNKKDTNLYSKYFNNYLEKFKNEKLLIGIFLIIILAFIYKKEKIKYLQ